MFGLFDSKKVTTVGTSVSRVIADNLLPDSIKTGVAKAIIENGDTTDYSLDQLTSSIGMRAERMYDWAANNYIYGLPSGAYKRPVDGEDQVDAILTAIENAAVEIDYSYYGPPNSLHIGWMQIIAQYGYNTQTNQLSVLSAIKGAPVYLEDMQVCVPSGSVGSYSAKALAQWGTSPRAGQTPARVFSDLRGHSPVFLDPGAADDYIRFTYVWGSATNLQRESLTIALTDYFGIASDGFFHVKYIVGGVIKYWRYKAGTGTYPTLDQVFNILYETNGTYFPFVYFRFNNQADSTDINNAAYISSKKITKFLGINYASMADAINQNPDIGSVRQAMLMMAVPANTTNGLELKYLYDYFDAQKYLNPVDSQTPLQQLTSVSVGMFNYAQDAYTSATAIRDNRFHMTLSNNGISKRRVAGTIGAIGSHTGSYATEVETFTAELNDEQTTSITVTNTKHYYRRQISIGFYDEIVVNNLKLRYHVVAGYDSLGTATNPILLIPIDRSITNDYPLSEREVLYARSLHYVINSVSEQTVEWYQQGWFRDFLFIAAVVVTVSSLGVDGGAAIALATSLNISVVAAATLLIMANIAIGLVIGEVFKLFVKAIGADAALALAVIAAVYGIKSAISNGSLQGAPWAKEMLQISSNLTKGISGVLAEDMVSLKQDYEAFYSYKSDAEKELEAANKLLEYKGYLEPMLLLGEEPQDFYNRTVHSGNVGVIGIGAISSYVENALELPKLRDEGLTL